MSAYDDIAQGLDEIRRSAFVAGTTKKSYRQASPQEAPRVFAYLDGGAEPSPFPTTLMGSGLTKVERGRRALVPEPPPPPDPDVTKTLNRFADFDPGIAWNKWQNVYQGSPTGSGTAWPDGGGIFEVSTPHGPGFRHRVTPAMIYQSTGDSKLARLSWGDGNPATLGFENKSQVWEWHWQFPSSDNVSGFPSSGLGPGELFLLRVTNSDGIGQPGYVGHGFNLGFVNSVLRFQHFRSTGSNTFSWTYGPNVNLDQWYKFRWEIRHSSGSDGYIRAFTDDVQWVNYVGPTIISNQQTQIVFCSLRNEADRTNGIVYANMRMTEVE